MRARGASRTAGRTACYGSRPSSRTGLSVAAIYRREGDDTFPRKERIGARCVARYESDIDDFVSDPPGYRAPGAKRVGGGGKPVEMMSAETCSSATRGFRQRARLQTLSDADPVGRRKGM
jgi:prophage regulatory protein